MIDGKYILLFFGYIFILGCNDNLNTIKETETVFYTQDSLYKVSFIKPEELDTFYSWMSSSDNRCDDEQRFRYSKKNFPITKETGWFKSPLADSTYRFTISHVNDYNCKSQTNLLNDNEPAFYLKNQYLKCKYAGWEVDTFFSKKSKINNRDFVIYAYRADERYRNKYYTNYVKAFTVIDNNILDFKCECRAKDCEKFIQRMEKSINTIKIEKYK